MPLAPGATMAIPLHPAEHPIRPGSLAAWSVAMRPRTLWIATVPVFVGTSLAWAESGAFDGYFALLALLASVLLQVISNLQNDVGYTERRAETGSRVGFPRATSNGWLEVAQVKRAVLLAIVAVWVVASPLIARWGAPVVMVGIGSTVSSWAYMGGPRPIAYTPFGELVVFVFFGLAAACGSYYVQTGSLSAAAWLAAGAIGLLASAVLAVNNHRDAAHDRTTGRRTFAVVFGERASRALFAALVLLPFALVGVLAFAGPSPWLGLPLLALPLATGLLRDFLRAAPGPVFNGLMLRTVKLELAVGGLLTLGALAAGRVA